MNLRVLSQKSLRSILWLIFVITVAPINKATAQEYISSGEFKSKLRFGSEMTISSDQLLKSYPSNGNVVQVSTQLADRKLEAMKRNIIRRYQSSGEVSPKFAEPDFHSGWSRKAFSITYPNGFKLTMFPDPGAIELNSSPSSVFEIEKNLKSIQKDFFDEGKAVGLEPALFAGSGHIHIEVAKTHPVTVRNFMADFFNTTGLAAGAFNEDIYNAIGTGELPEENKKKLRAAFVEFDKVAEPDMRNLPWLVGAAYDVPYDLEPSEYQKMRNGKRPSKYHSISFTSFYNLGTIELRSIRPQASAESYLKLIKLFTARMELAERKRVQGIRVPIGELRSVKGNPKAVLADFDRYLTEVGLDIRDYREFVMPWWQLPNSDFDKYLSERPAGRGVARACKAAFGL